MITVELKDRILNDFVNTGINIAVDIHETCKNYDIDSGILCLILDQFEKFGYIQQQKFLGGAILVSPLADAHDLVRQGGFTVKEELLKANIEKLGLEIDLLCKQLTPDQLEQAHKITAIGASILSTLKLIV